MKNRTFYDLNHINQYLAGSLIMIKGRPAYVREVNMKGLGPNYSIYYSRIGDAEILDTVYPNEDVDMSPIKLGMLCNEDVDGAYQTWYACRSPVRAWRIGLTFKNSKFYEVPGNRVSEDNVIFFSMNSLEKTILGEYLPFKTVATICMNDHKSTVPFSRRFAISKGNKLFYKNWPKPVGVIKKGKLEVKLHDNFFYLEQVLQEDLNDN